jgi:hypothetical protein
VDTPEEQERRRFKDVIREDAQQTRSQLGDRIRDTLSRPINLLFVAVGAILVFGIDYAAEKAVDAMLDIDPPQVVQLDTDLKSASAELQQSANEIRAMISEIDLQTITDEGVRQQFESLQSRLTGLTEIVERASAQTDKVAAISEALREDWERNRRLADGRVDSIPDLVLGAGEAVSVCSGMASVGVVKVTEADGTAHVKANDWTYWVNPGQRVPLEGGATLGFIGLKEGVAQMKVQCPG